MMRTLPDQTEMERATYRRDTSYDGLFFVCVRSTGIFCRPSCPARKPLARNMEYRAAVRDCLLAGYRPCKRCRPLATNGQSPAWLDELIGRVEARPTERLTDVDLRVMGVNPHRARRYFAQHFDMTFQAYHRARRMGMALEALRAGGDPLKVALHHGFDSPSGFRDAFARTFGATPGRNAKIVCITTRTLESPIGPLLAGATADGVCLLLPADVASLRRQIAGVRKRLEAAILPGTSLHLDQLAGELERYFDGRLREFTVPLVAPGTAFQERVWGALRSIPFGQTRSYAQLAALIGRPGAHRPVGRANGDNPIAILIPCHRVIATSGALCGYGGGLWRKRFLLDLEQRANRQDASNGGLTASRDGQLVGTDA